ncbi:MAG: hypothetical protein JNL74_17860 [Fibrobacteres bacterium]|nr:hypothetical protein [Fibrobacterota bacterium]
MKECVRLGNVYVADSGNVFSWDTKHFLTSKKYNVKVLSRKQHVRDISYYDFSSLLFSNNWFMRYDDKRQKLNILVNSTRIAFKKKISFDIKNNLIETELCSPTDPNKFDKLLFHPSDIIIAPYLHAAYSAGEILHCSAVKIKKKVYLFLGKSEAGKSTISLLFDKFLAKNKIGSVINDEKNVISLTPYMVYGTPWSGEAAFRSGETGDLGGVFFIDKSEKCSIRRISNSEAFARFQQVHYAPYGIKHFMEQSADNFIKLIKDYQPKIFSFAKSEITPEWFIKNVVERES